MSDASHLLPELDPPNNADDKKKFYKRARSQMINQSLEGVIPTP